VVVSDTDSVRGEEWHADYHRAHKYLTALKRIPFLRFDVTGTELYRPN